MRVARGERKVVLHRRGRDPKCLCCEVAKSVTARAIWLNQSRMKVILCWKQPRAYKLAVAREVVKLMWRGVIVGTALVLILGSIAINYLRRLDAAEADRVMPVIFTVPEICASSVFWKSAASSYHSKLLLVDERRII